MAMPAILFSGSFFIVLRLAHQCLGLIICRHPLFAGAVLWLVFRDDNLLLAALFFELFWLDLFHAGTFVPPDSMLSLLVFVPLTRMFSLESPEDFTAALLCCLPLAELGARLDQHLRRLRSAAHEALNNSVRNSGDIVGFMDGMVGRGLYSMILLRLLLYALALSFLGAVFYYLRVHFGSVCRTPWSTWGALLGFAALGGVLALRIPAALICFVVSAVVLGLFFLF
jgi:PTS system mannose-specific IIC component